jgi:hypothetical protein
MEKEKDSLFSLHYQNTYLGFQLSFSSEAPLYYPILIAKEKVQTTNQYSTMSI